MTSGRHNRGGHIRLEDVSMAYGDRLVFEGLSCEFPPGKISVILGGSGVGKSTILRLIGGLVRPLRGKVLVDGENVAAMSERELYKVRIKLGMMFQGGALLDSMTVFDNLALPLREHSDMDEEEIAWCVHRRLAAVGLAGVDDLLPGQLSGGMVKRVALARALMRDPVVVLADEAFSGLDPLSIKRIEALLVGINRELGMTMVLVSHHIPSTLRMADRVLLLMPDRAVEGSPAELMASADPDVRGFLDEDALETTTLDREERSIERRPDAGRQR
ncbi:MAG: ATP-binding cassette domain-containing protein [Candidatus Dadabacteria bacterium]|nr:MAG: ATP-binding cassette domain-containing protein [Candidatus Dadabacteria bacterium]